MTRPTSPQSPPRPPGLDGSIEAASETSHPGTYFIGRYRVVDDIGVGGMATVHLGRVDGAGGFQKWVAIKRIHPHLVENEQVIKMFLDEARIAASISHPNVALVFDLGSHENTHWIAMEYLHGEPLREVLRHVMEAGPEMEPSLAARIIADAAEGLHAAHELRGKDGRPLNLVHRDVTPHNLFVTYDGVVKVVDFGIAKVTGRLSNTQAGTLKGKIAYMAPEQIKGIDIDRRTDIFALGVVLWELTTGRRLFRMDTDLETVERVQACVVPPPSSMSADYPAELETIVLRALCRNPSDRFRTARGFSRALQQYIMHAGQFVGPEEISAYVKGLFGERIKQREAHLKWAADVTKTLAFGQIRPAIVAAGVDLDAALRDLESSGSSNPVAVESFNDDDDDADETVVEPFRAAMMRQEAVHFGTERPQRPSFTRTPAPGSSSSSRERVRIDSADATDPSTTRKVVSADGVQCVSAPFLELDDLVDDEDEENIETMVRDPNIPLVKDRLIVQSYRPPAARLAEPEQPNNPPSPVGSPPLSVSANSAGVAPPGTAQNPDANPAAEPQPTLGTSTAMPAPDQSGPLPAFDQSATMPQAYSTAALRPPPGVSSVRQAVHPSVAILPTRLSNPATSQPAQNAYVTGDYPPVDPYFDETQWARGVRGKSPVAVYIAAAIGGFLIVAVLIAMLLEGPKPDKPFPPTPTPSPTGT